ncbi:MAG TPA: (Fe-S)-binding protein [Gammaproteobacteria bacterium]|nr:(Fe-S)-binding protein [Gammaproteobacteria bacterium]
MARPLPDFPLADADKCVKCALCLPHCPTYRVTLDEGESPRGRIALMQGLANGALDATPHLAAHLDHCLACRACEAVCPAEVPYGKLIDAARLELGRQGLGEPAGTRLFAFFMTRPLLRRWSHRILWWSGRIGLTGLLRRANGFGSAALRRRLELLPEVTKPRAWRREYQPRASSKTTASLFLGCVADITQPQVSAAAVLMLNALGVELRLPRNQGCCGALDQHAGRKASAGRLARKNLEAFSGSEVILGTASGCLATLKDYPEILGSYAGDFADRVQDVSEFISRHPRLGKIQFHSWKAKALVQTPCTLRNVLKTGASVPELLHRIPKLQVDSLPASLGCCGAAGSYMLTQAEQADAFAAEFAEAIAQRKPDVLVSSNVGCALHLSAALKRRGLDIPVMHPVEILAKQLPEALYRPV